MRARPLGVVVLWILGATLLGAGVGAGALRIWAVGQGSDWVGWTYVGTASAVALGGIAWAIVRWRRHAPPFAGDPDPREAPWWVAAVVSGAGTGTFAGALHQVGSGVHVGPLLSYFVYFPVACVAAILTAPTWRAAVRVIVMSAALERAAQASYSAAIRGRWEEWDDITVATALAAACAVVAAIVHAPFRGALATRLARLRPEAAPPRDPDAPPLRA